MRLAFTALLLLLGIGPAGAHAGELSLLINGKAIHLDSPPGAKFNEANWGGGLQYDWDRTGRTWVPFLSASGFLDSVHKSAYYAGGGYLRRWPLGNTWHADTGLIAFLVTLTDYNDGRPFPGILPMVSLGTARVSLNATYVPRLHPKMVSVVFLQLKIGLAP